MNGLAADTDLDSAAVYDGFLDGTTLYVSEIRDNRAFRTPVAVATRAVAGSATVSGQVAPDWRVIVTPD